MIFNVAQDKPSPKHGKSWYELFRQRLTNLSGRKPPAWASGTVEAFVLVEVDFDSGPSILTTSHPFDEFFDTLVAQIKARNPKAIPA